MTFKSNKTHLIHIFPYFQSARNLLLLFKQLQVASSKRVDVAIFNNK